MNRPDLAAVAFSLLLLAPLAASTGCERNAGSKTVSASPAIERIPVAVVTVAPATIESALEVSGSLAPQARVGIGAKMPGTLERIAVQLGDHVQAGTIIATLDRREIAAQVDAAAAAVNVARAALSAAEAGLANAGQEIERARTLFEKGAIPRQRLDAAETAHTGAVAQRDLGRANLAQADAALRRAREIARDAILTAPISGVIVERNLDAGALVGRGEAPLAVVADSRVLKLEAGVSELEAGRLRVGMAAVVSVQAKPGRTFPGRVAALAPEVDARNRHFRVEIRIDNPREEVLPGMFAIARIVSARADGALAVPKEAVMTRNGARAVYRLEGDTIRITPVSEGLTDGRRVQVVSGLAAGAIVVGDARRDIADGVRVRPIG
jgi:RND family efflux transporter MFP subunit